MGDGKAKNVIEYLENLETKGKASAGAISPLKISFTKVMQQVDGEDWGEVDVRSIDIEDYMSRFANLTMGKYASDSLTTYKSRVGRALSWYIQFLEKPGWTPEIGRRNRTTKKVSKISTSTTHSAVSSTTVIPQQSNVSNEVNPYGTGFERTAGRILYPYPLLDGQLVHISLPVKLSSVDAKRLGAFIESIAIDQEGLNE